MKLLKVAIGMIVCAAFMNGFASKCEASVKSEDIDSVIELSHLDRGRTDDGMHAILMFSTGDMAGFMERGEDPVREFTEKLSQRLQANVTFDWYLGRRVIYVPIEKYKQGLLSSLELLESDYPCDLKYGCCMWVDGGNWVRGLEELFDSIDSLKTFFETPREDLERLHLQKMLNRWGNRRNL